MGEGRRAASTTNSFSLANEQRLKIKIPIKEHSRHNTHNISELEVARQSSFPNTTHSNQASRTNVYTRPAWMNAIRLVHSYKNASSPPSDCALIVATGSSSATRIMATGQFRGYDKTPY